MPIFLAVATGGACGALLRWGIVARVAAPLGVLGVNILGSFAIGILAGLLASGAWGASQAARSFWIVGVLGGFTTFSAFSLDVAALAGRGQTAAAAAYAVASPTLSIASAFLGLWLAKTLSATV